MTRFGMQNFAFTSNLNFEAEENLWILDWFMAFILRIFQISLQKVDHSNGAIASSRNSNRTYTYFETAMTSPWNKCILIRNKLINLKAWNWIPFQLGARRAWKSWHETTKWRLLFIYILIEIGKKPTEVLEFWFWALNSSINLINNKQCIT